MSRTRQLLGVWLQEGDQGRRLLQHVMAPRQQRRSAVPAQHEISHNRPAESAANEFVLCNRRRMGGPLVKEQDVLGSRNDEVERMPGMSRKTARTPPHTHTVGWLTVNLNGAAGARIGYPRTLSATEGSGNVDLTVFRVTKSKRSSSGAARRLTISSERGCAPNVHTQSPTPALLRIRRERLVSHHNCG